MCYEGNELSARLYRVIYQRDYSSVLTASGSIIKNLNSSVSRGVFPIVREKKTEKITFKIHKIKFFRLRCLSTQQLTIYSFKFSNNCQKILARA